MTDPYRPPDVDAAKNDPSTESSKTRKTFGVIFLVFAVLSLRGIQRPPNSTGNLLDDLPFLGGQLFVTAALATVGLFLLLKKPPSSKRP